jgi:Tol biopolymer transport system component/tRNA A-37 threonylcarbamoyl transferase component Bud32
VPLSPHTRLGPYEILSVIGVGGMGEVYKARDTRLDRTVAIKVLPERRYNKPRARERFEREAKVISGLNHPHICTLHDVGHGDGVDYLVMEYLEGQTLADRLKKEPLPRDQALNYALQIAGALDQAHRHGVVHRDLKPGNIMLTKAGAKLLDFGLAKMDESVAAAASEERHTAAVTETAGLTREGKILGTLPYVAPEQLEGREADARTDIFSFGTVLYEMLTGHKAFEAKSQAGLISAIMSAQPPPVSSVQALASPAVDHIVSKCLAKDPEERWQNTRDLETELKWIAAGGGTLTTRASRRRGERLAWAVAACSVIALTAALAMMYLRPTAARRQVQFDVFLPDNRAVGFLGSPSVSPDGRYVAISVDEGLRTRLWLHDLTSRAMKPLAGTEGVDSYFWSPDSRQIAFSTDSGLKKIGIGGGPAQTIWNGAVTGVGAWNQHGVILFGRGVNQPLYQASVMGGEPKRLTKLDQSRQETGHLFPQFLPDGRHFIYLAWSNKPEDIGTYLGSLDSSEVKRIHDGNTNAMYGPTGHLIFRRGASLMAQRFDLRRAEVSGDPVLLLEPVSNLVQSPWGNFSVSDNGVLTYLSGSSQTLTQLMWVDRSGKRLGTVGEPAAYSNPSISPDQTRIAVGKMDPQTSTRDIWILDLQRGTSSRFTFDPSDDMNPSWSPDGKRIAFTSDRKGHRDIYAKPASGAGEEQIVLQSEESKSVEDWSPDGQYLLWGTNTEEWLFSFSERRSMLLPKFTEDQGRFCPSRGGPPRWFAYTSSETGAQQVYVRSFAGALSGSGGKWQISATGGSEPHWRGDGRELFFLNGNKLMAVEVNGDGESFQAGAPKELFETRLPEPRRNRYDVTADGKRFLLNLPVQERERTGFTVVLNWPALLKR